MAIKKLSNYDEIAETYPRVALGTTPENPSGS